MAISTHIPPTGLLWPHITRITIPVLILFYSSTLFAQNWQDTISTSYRQVLQQKAREINREGGRAIPLNLLALRLSAKATTPFEKIWLSYNWIGQHIRYDHKALQPGAEPAVLPDEVLQRGKALCEGYALLFEALCNRLDIDCRSISGYSKGDGYVPGQAFTRSDHSWNVVWWQGQWHPVDVTWGAAGDADPGGNREINYAYLMARPEEFLSTHLPEDPNWQLLPFSLSLKSFHSYSAQNQLDLPKHTQGQVPDNAELEQQWLWEVEKNQRIGQYNPHKQNASYWLAQAWLYTALDLRDSIYHFSPEALMAQDTTLLDQFLFRMGKADSVMGIYCSKQREEKACFSFEQEKRFQRGIFHYELASYLLWGLMELYDNEPARYKAQSAAIRNTAGRHYDFAEDWLNRVDKQSIYHSEVLKTLQTITDARRNGL